MKNVLFLDLEDEEEREEAIERTEMIKDQIELGEGFEYSDNSLTVQVNNLIIDYRYMMLDERTFLFIQEIMRGAKI